MFRRLFVSLLILSALTTEGIYTPPVLAMRICTLGLSGNATDEHKSQNDTGREKLSKFESTLNIVDGTKVTDRSNFINDMTSVASAYLSSHTFYNFIIVRMNGVDLIKEEFPLHRSGLSPPCFLSVI